MWKNYEKDENYVLEFIENFIKNGVDIDFQSKYGTTALIWASKCGHIKLVKLLLKYDANINVQNNDKDTALIISCYSGHKDIVRKLEVRYASK